MMTMPAKPQTPVMKPGELRALMDAHGLTGGALADLLGIHRNTVSRWLTYEANGKGETVRGTPIDAANALLVRTKLAELKRKK